MSDLWKIGPSFIANQGQPSTCGECIYFVDLECHGVPPTAIYSTGYASGTRRPSVGKGDRGCSIGRETAKTYYQRLKAEREAEERDPPPPLEETILEKGK